MGVRLGLAIRLLHQQKLAWFDIVWDGQGAKLLLQSTTNARLEPDMYSVLASAMMIHRRATVKGSL